MPLSLVVIEEAFADVSVGSSHAAEVYYCHQGSCFRVFYRLSTQMRHLSQSELKWTNLVERESLRKQPSFFAPDPSGVRETCHTSVNLCKLTNLTRNSRPHPSRCVSSQYVSKEDLKFYPIRLALQPEAPFVQTLDSAIHRINCYPASRQMLTKQIPLCTG